MICPNLVRQLPTESTTHSDVGHFEAPKKVDLLIYTCHGPPTGELWRTAYRFIVCKSFSNVISLSHFNSSFYIRLDNIELENASEERWHKFLQISHLSQAAKVDYAP